MVEHALLHQPQHHGPAVLARHEVEADELAGAQPREGRAAFEQERGQARQVVRRAVAPRVQVELRGRVSRSEKRLLPIGPAPLAIARDAVGPARDEHASFERHAMARQFTPEGVVHGRVELESFPAAVKGEGETFEAAKRTSGVVEGAGRPRAGPVRHEIPGAEDGNGQDGATRGPFRPIRRGIRENVCPTEGGYSVLEHAKASAGDVSGKLNTPEHQWFTVFLNRVKASSALSARLAKLGNILPADPGPRTMVVMPASLLGLDCTHVQMMDNAHPVFNEDARELLEDGHQLTVFQMQHGIRAINNTLSLESGMVLLVFRMKSQSQCATRRSWNSKFSEMPNRFRHIEMTFSRVSAKITLFSHCANEEASRPYPQAKSRTDLKSVRVGSAYSPIASRRFSSELTIEASTLR